MYHYERSKALSPSKQQAQPGQDILIEPAVTSPVRDPWESEGRKFITKVFQNVLRREPLLPGLDHKGNLSVTNKLLDLFPFFFFFFFLEPSQQRYLEHWLSRQVLHELLKESRVALWTDPSLEPVTLGSHCRSTTCQLFMALCPELHFSISQPPLLQARIVKFLAYSGSVINGSSCY